MIGVGGGGFHPPILPLTHAIQHLGLEKNITIFKSITHTFRLPNLPKHPTQKINSKKYYPIGNL